MWIVIIIVVVVFFIFIKSNGNSKQNVSNKAWYEILQNPEISDEDKIGIRQMLIPDSINPIYFINNILFLNGDPFNIDKNTPSIKPFQSRFDRPMLPDWFLAAYPDVLLFIRSARKDESLTARIEKELNFLGINNNETSETSIKTSKAFVIIFKKLTGKKLETSL